MNGNTSAYSRRISGSLGLRGLLALTLVFSCTSLPSEADQIDESAVADMVLMPAEAVVGVGRTIQLQVTFLNTQRQPVTGNVDTWESSNTQIATVDGRGVVTAVAVGETDITASARQGGGKGRETAPGQLKKKSTIIVSPDPVAAVEVAPSSANLSLGGTMQFEAVTKDAAGNVLRGRYVAWASSNSQVATANNDGVVSGAGSGSAMITATSEGIDGIASVDVTGVLQVLQVAIWPSGVDVEPGQRVQFYSAALLSDGQKVCDSNGASPDQTVLFNLTDYPAACDSAIARLISP